MSIAVVPDLSTHVVVAPSTALRVVSTTPFLQWKPFQEFCRRHNSAVLCVFLAALGIVVEWSARNGSHDVDAHRSLLFAAGHSMMGVGFGVQVLRFNRQKMMLVLQTLTFWFLSVNFITFQACQALLAHMLFNVPASVAIMLPMLSMVPYVRSCLGSLKHKLDVILATVISSLLSILLQQSWASIQSCRRRYSISLGGHSCP